MSTSNQKHTFHIHGMHCNACALIIEDELINLEEVTEVKANLNNHTVEVTGNFERKTSYQITQDLSEVLKQHGYIISNEKQRTSVQWKDFKIAVPVALTFVILFILLQKLGIVNLINSGTVTYGTAFAIGIIASLSTCMAVVGGLVLSMSATFAKEGDKVRPQIMFHAGRIISFFILGGIIGVVGSIFSLTTSATFTLGLLIGIVMLILGINLLDVFSWSKRLQPSMPKFIARHTQRVSKLNHTFTPVLIGIVTFFLPCGFTQSMQIYTLTTGSFLQGGLTMLSFALGTLPVLALVSFSSFSIQNKKSSGVFFKSAGLIVILFALFNLINSFVVIGLIPPIFNF